jgi:hypothetical protein
MCALPNGICDYGFATVVKKPGNKPGNTPNLPNSGIHKSRLAMVSVMHSTILPVISQKPKLKSPLFISHCGPDIWPQILKFFERTLKNNSPYLHPVKKM